ncbi:MAG: hypothetical protein LBN95_03840 [Prevotellaceae bacterium]|jgi:hypothetical protein|nr:hypothetical protein [Prevotellaceae bacterium]
MLNNQQTGDIIHSNIIGANILCNENNTNAQKTPKWVYWFWLPCIIAIGLSIASIFIVADIKWNVEVVSTAIILGFVGILATFIVVSNYLQVKDIEKKFEDRVGELDKKFKEKIKYNIQKNETYIRKIMIDIAMSLKASQAYNSCFHILWKNLEFIYKQSSDDVNYLLYNEEMIIDIINKIDSLISCHKQDIILDFEYLVSMLPIMDKMSSIFGDKIKQQEISIFLQSIIDNIGIKK